MSKDVEVQGSSTALVPITEYAVLAESPENLRAIVADNLGNGTLSPFDLEQIRVPAGGSTLWERKSFDHADADKDGNYQVREIQGVVVYFRDLRAWWEASFDDKEGAAPPDCQSQDNIHGTGKFGAGSAGNPTGLCSQCPKAQWGSNRKGGKGQDCSQVRSIFLIEKEGLLPLHIKLPPTSVKECRKFFIGDLASKGIPHWGVIVRLSLFKDKNDAGIVYSKVRFAGARVGTEAKERLSELHNAMKSALSSITIDMADVRTAESDSTQQA